MSRFLFFVVNHWHDGRTSGASRRVQVRLWSDELEMTSQVLESAPMLL